MLRSYGVTDELTLHFNINDIAVGITFNNNKDNWHCFFNYYNSGAIHALTTDNMEYSDLNISDNELVNLIANIELQLDDVIIDEIDKQIKSMDKQIDILDKKNQLYERVNTSINEKSKITVKGIDYKVGDTIFIVDTNNIEELKKDDFSTSNHIHKFVIDGFGDNNRGHKEAIQNIGSLHSYADLEFYPIFSNYDNAESYIELLKIKQNYIDTHNIEDINTFNQIIEDLKNLIICSDKENVTMDLDLLKFRFSCEIKFFFDEDIDIDNEEKDDELEY